MKKIGFIDYYLSEWHANNYPAWITEEASKLGLEYKIAYAWAEENVSPVDNITTEEWCEKHGAVRCETVSELCEKSDVIVILAPSNPEKHLGYAQEALKYGKRTYIDKTFAPDYATAKQIFELGEKHGAAFFSSSALRYTAALSDMSGVTKLTTFGGGSLFDEYIVHQAEMVVSVLKKAPVSVKVEKQGSQYITSVKLEDGYEATMIFSPVLPFSLKGEADGGKLINSSANDAFFNGLIKDMISFFETGKVSFDVNETLEVMKLREAAIRGTKELGKWLSV